MMKIKGTPLTPARKKKFKFIKSFQKKITYNEHRLQIAS